MTPDDFRADLRRVRTLLEDELGAPVRGYRAPTYSVTRATPWAHEILAEEGFAYSSSIFPIVHDRYGIPDYARFPVKLDVHGHALWEFPLTTVRVGGKNLPIAGGGYLRFLPVEAVVAGLSWVNVEERQPAILYLHPWEVDPEIPRFSQGLLRDLRGYRGLDGMLAKLDLLMSRFTFDRVDRVLGLVR